MQEQFWRAYLAFGWKEVTGIDEEYYLLYTPPMIHPPDFGE